MAFNHDTSSPADLADISLYPNNERAHRLMVETFLNLEHDSVEGRHRFGVGTNAARGVITTWVVGAFWISTDEIAGQFVLQVLNALPSDWKNTGTVFTGLTQIWSVAQFGDVEDLGSISGPVNMDLEESHLFRVSATGNITVPNPTNVPTAGAETTAFTLEIYQSAGPHTITWTGSLWRASFGIAPQLTPTIGAVDIFSCIVGFDGNITVSHLPDRRTI